MLYMHISFIFYGATHVNVFALYICRCVSVTLCKYVNICFYIIITVGSIVSRLKRREVYSGKLASQCRNIE